MFERLTSDLLDLQATALGEGRQLFAMVQSCCSCCCCCYCLYGGCQ
jgi:hypothetical protein